jgi:hypothetical protein
MGFTVPKTWSSGETLTAANFNTYIRDNQLSFGPHLLARKTSDQSVTSSTALVSDTALVTPSIPANEVWRFQLFIRVTGLSGADIRHSFQIPTGGTLDMMTLCVNAAGTQDVQDDELTTSDTPIHTAVLDNSKTFPIEVLYINGANAGVITFRWAQNTSNATATTVKTNSTLWGVKLA